MSISSELLAETVRARLDSLTKPPGSLGQLEQIALKFALIRGMEMPSSARKGLYIFCGDHGVTAEGVSRYPSSVTRQMTCNFASGGGAINVLCRRNEIQPVIVDVGVSGPAVPGVLDRKIAPGTRNLRREPAMSRLEAEAALQIGRELAVHAAEKFDMAGVGEMGIGNTTSAAALLSAFTGLHPSGAVGSGTGMNAEGMSRKADVIGAALTLHRPDPKDAVGVLAAVGGFEIAAITGFILGASTHRLPVVLDGFPCCSAALAARAISPDALSTAFFGHLSAERGHAFLLEWLNAEPLLSLGMRLGEGTGAALAIGIIDAAVLLYREMATFEEAAIDGSEASEAGHQGSMVL
jgi:nicotinate-nucleotide--dimethylbenzimidazole phosphoribosyltransferase